MRGRKLVRRTEAGRNTGVILMMGSEKSLDQQMPPAHKAPVLEQPAQADLSAPGLPGSAGEELALALLQNRDLPPESVEHLGKSAIAAKSRKVRFALATHPRSARHLALRLVREFYTMDLMRFALVPGVAADLKHAADGLLVARLASITLGERISLARRASGTVAAALLLDREERVWMTALDNPRLTEARLIRTLMRGNIPFALIENLCRHAEWSPRPEIRMALLGNEKTPLDRALELAGTLSPAQVRDILHSSRLPETTKAHLLKELKAREKER